MTSNEGPPRKPGVFGLSDPHLVVESTAPLDSAVSAADAVPITPRDTAAGGGIGWGGLFLGALGGLLVLGATIWIEGLLANLIARDDGIGWLAAGLLGVAVFAFLMMVLREAAGLFRLSAMTDRRQAAEICLSQGDEKAARAVEKAVRAQLAGRPELRHALKRLDTFQGDVMEARQRLALTERELMAPLDREARGIIAAAARRVSIVTALSPFAAVDIGFVTYENVRMLRRLAVLYGGRPGTLAMLRLLRLVTGHLAVTGGLAVTDDFVHQLVGQGLTARLSSRLGEGVVNGAFTVRIGLAAIEVLRPLPYIEASPPRLRDFLTDVFRKPTGEEQSRADAPAGRANKPPGSLNG